VRFEAAALDRMIELSGCYPAFIQAYGKEVWNMAPASPIALADVESAEPLVVAKLDDEFFHARFEKATPSERRYMAAMADLGEGPYRTRDIIEKLGGHSGVSTHRDALIKKGLIFSPDFGLSTSPCPTSPRSCADAIHSSLATLHPRVERPERGLTRGPENVARRRSALSGVDNSGTLVYKWPMSVRHSGV
jgi:hypothetical protein